MLETIGSKNDRREAISKRAKGAWDFIFGLLNIQPTTEPIDMGDISNADNPSTRALFQIYSLETWLFREINNASRTKNSRKVQSLGPFAALIGVAMDNAQRSRKDSILGQQSLYKPMLVQKNEAT